MPGWSASADILALGTSVEEVRVSHRMRARSVLGLHYSVRISIACLEGYMDPVSDLWNMFLDSDFTYRFLCLSSATISMFPSGQRLSLRPVHPWETAMHPSRLPTSI